MAGTIVAVATAPGPAATGVVRVSGPAAFSLAGARFVSDAGQHGLPRVRGATRGVWVLTRDGAATPVDMWAFVAPHSFTGEDVVELHLPGAPHLLCWVIELFLGAGASLAHPGDFTRRAVVHGRMDLTRAEAVLALIHARDEAAHDQARALLDGGLAREVAALEGRLVNLLVPLELGLDFSDQDVATFMPPDHAERTRALGAETAALGADTRVTGRRQLPRVVLRGPANAGKSSLFNALLRVDRALTSPTAGTTRDVVTADWTHRGVRACLVDTAGDDVTTSPLDDAAHAMRARALLEADVVVDVRDARLGGWPATNHVNRVAVATFGDLTPEAAAVPLRAGGIAVVANPTRCGVDAVADAIVAALAAGAGARLSPFLVTARQGAALKAAAEAMTRAADAVDAMPAEFAASDLREALRHLRTVFATSPDDPVFTQIFREFCIGK